MTAAAYLGEGHRRIGAGLNLIGQALKELIIGAYGLVSGLCLVLIGAVLGAGGVLGWVVGGLAGLVMRPLRFLVAHIALPHFKLPHITLPHMTLPRFGWPDFKFPRLTLPHFKWTGFSFRALDLSLPENFPISGRTIWRAFVFLASAAMFAGVIAASLGVTDWRALIGWVALAGGCVLALVLLAWLAALFLQKTGALLIWGANRAPRVSIRTVLALVVIASFGGAIAWMFVTGQSPPLIALLAVGTLVAGASGIAVFSFGPTQTALFPFGGIRSPSLGARSDDEIEVAFEPAPSMPSAPRPTLEAPRRASGDTVHRDEPIRRPPPLPAPTAAAPQRGASAIVHAVRRTGFVLGVAVVAVAVLLAVWFGGPPASRIATTHPTRFAAHAAAKGRGGAAHTPPRIILAPSGAQAIALIADGRIADLSWRDGYRGVVTTLSGERAVKRLRLPASACGAGAIVAFGAASSDGAVPQNRRLAAARASWLGDWVRQQTDVCPKDASVPAVIEVSLGAATAPAPTPAQRRVRLAVVNPSDLNAPAVAGDQLRKMVGALFPDIADFEQFDACRLRDRGSEHRTLLSIPQCAAPGAPR